MNFLDHFHLLPYFPLFGAILTIICLIFSVKSTLKAYRNRGLKLGDKFVLNKTLNPLGILEALNKLHDFIQAHNPDYIIGVNRGGILVSAYVCFILGIDDKKFLRCLVSKRDEQYKILHPTKNIGYKFVCPDLKKLMDLY